MGLGWDRRGEQRRGKERRGVMNLSRALLFADSAEKRVHEAMGPPLKTTPR